jgi:hypothetical protein
MKIRPGSFLAACVLLSLCSPSLLSGQVVEETLAFARSLQTEGDYYRAITEYKRVLFLAPLESTAIRESAILGVGGALFSGAEYARSAEWLHAHLIDLRGEDERAQGIRLMWRAFLAEGAGDRLMAVSQELGDPSPEAKLYEGLAFARVGHWGEASVVFRELSGDSRFGSLAIGFASLAHDAEHASWKSPVVAATLGLMPGAGYWYARHRQTAVASLLVNSLFIGATIQAFRADQDILGGFLTLFSVSWYAGNVYGSALAARRYNENLQTDLWSRFEY